ncbi:HlyD family efflux transporter periplasmic adaptor subunit [Actinoplanes sp. NPDC051851]|uniref:efflux RND transporter periplasmic adaptor subunit n=1 Tax=Actinoplanes sp. NPDC051851 TaxID=3154753 RepID=UPI00342F694C
MSRAVIIFSALLLLPLTAASCDDADTGIRLGAASLGTVDEIVEAPGSVTARAAATLTAPAAGTLADLRVEAGDRVSKGDVLAVLDSPTLRRQLASASRALSSGVSIPRSGPSFSTKNTDKKAAKAFSQARKAAEEIADPQVRAALLRQVDVAEQQYANASTAASTAVRAVQDGVASLGEAVSSLAAAQRLQAQQAYDLADAAVDALTLRAPIGGVIQLGGPASTPTTGLTGLLSSSATSSAVDTAVVEGAYLAPGTPVATVVDTGRLGLTAEVDETDVLLVRPGVRADVELDAATGAVYAATVRSVDLLPTTSAQGGVSYQVRLNLGQGSYADGGGAAPAPRPGMSAVVRLRVREASGAITVPASAVVSADGRDTVWSVQDGRFRACEVRLGVQGEETVQIVSGVTAGQQVVVSGTDRVHDGDEAP